MKPVDVARMAEEYGAGEIYINSVDRDGTMKGFDLHLIREVSEAVGIPVIASGGAGSFQDLSEAINDGGASAASAGSIFVFHGEHRAVLIDFPNPKKLNELFSI